MLSAEEKKEALAIALASETFARSEQQRAFLRFVCEMEISGHGAEVTEYLIGVHALGRPPDFSPLEDSSVRTRAYELRQRLHKYYTVENPATPVRIELPKGTYMPHFEVVMPAEPATLPPAAAPAVALPRRNFGWAPRWVGGFLAGAVLASLAALAIFVRIKGSDADAAIKLAWLPLIDRDAEIVICLGTTLNLLVTPYLGVVPQNGLSYPAPQELYGLFSRYRDLPPNAHLEMQPVQKNLFLGDVEGLATVLRTLQVLHSKFRILPETSSPLVALRRNNAVLFGSPWYSRSATVLLENTPWTTRWDETTHQVGLFNREAGNGKWLVPGRGPRNEYREVFGLVTVLPNDSKLGGTRSIFVFSGLTSVGTHGAAAFFTSAADLRNLQERFRKQGLRAWPRSFQIVVRCRSSEDSQLLSYAYETHAILLK